MTSDFLERGDLTLQADGWYLRRDGAEVQCLHEKEGGFVFNDSWWRNAKGAFCASVGEHSLDIIRELID